MDDEMISGWREALQGGVRGEGLPSPRELWKTRYTLGKCIVVYPNVM